MLHHSGHLDAPTLLLESPLITLAAAKAGHRGFGLEDLPAAFTNSVDDEIRTHIMDLNVRHYQHKPATH